MSRVAKSPVTVPKGVEIKQSGSDLTVKGPKGELNLRLNPEVVVTIDAEAASVAPKGESRFAYAIAGTTRALLNNMMLEVSEGFERKLELVGVGYRAKVQGAKLNLTLGFSHPINYQIPEGVTVETPSQTEVIVKGIDKQRVGQVAAEIRSYKSPEPYKGKGVRYLGEYVFRKEGKKK